MKLGLIAKHAALVTPVMLIALLGACEGDGGEGPGASDQGAAGLGKGASCTYAGGTFEDGRSFSSPDGCNSCRCENGNAICTKRGCAPLPPPLPPSDAGPVGTPPDAAVVPDAEAPIDAGAPVDAAPPAPDAASGCVYGGVTHAQGTSFPSLDKCNTCFCGSGGRVACTKKLCKGDAGEP